ncbi:MAG: adenine deaminase [Chloroflexi bacterium RBG_16_56_11]|nr:MAG: adenine deaminase [Chloroflexi bacterium RBG_16_56_11]
MMTNISKVQKLISVARGQASADLVLANARVVNTFNGKIEKVDVAICGDRVAGLGDYKQAKKVVDLAGRYVVPGLINGHTHIESSMLDVGEYARAVVPHGTAAVGTALHEIANVCGTEGLKYVLDSARRLPLDLFLMAPSCVPATHLETSGAAIGVDDIRRILRWRGCIGLGEVMNYPGVLLGDGEILGKIAAARGRVIDGHAPGLKGKDLDAYIAAGIGSDHECVTLAEAEEKLRRGMHIMIREGSAEKNLEALLPLVTDRTYTRCLFVTDDRHAEDILRDGDVDAVVRKAIRLGLDPVRAVQMATINPAAYFRLERLGAVAPGYYANLLVLDDLAGFTVNTVYYHGRPVAQEGKPLFTPRPSRTARPTHTVNIKPFTVGALKLRARGANFPVIEVIPGQIITKKRQMNIMVKEEFIEADVERDVLKAVVVERHHATGNIGVGLVTGFGLKKGALASSTAHDSHNIVAVGASDEDIFAAVKEIERRQGGLVAVADRRVVVGLSTPVAGLLSTEPLEEVVAGLERLEKAARGLGATLPSPFATLSFLALPVIPELRLTDLGLVDVNEFKLIT